MLAPCSVQASHNSISNDPRGPIFVSRPRLEFTELTSHILRPPFRQLNKWGSMDYMGFNDLPSLKLTVDP